MIPRQSRKISFFDEYVQTITVEFFRRMIIINNILIFVIFVIFIIFDVKSDAILNKQNSLNNNTDLDGKYGYDSALSYAGGYSLAFYGYYCIYCVFTCCWCSCMSTDCICVTLAFIFNIIGACSSIPLALPYLKDQIIGPDHQIISCGHIEVLDSWLNDWCTLNKLRIILSWLLILAWLMIYIIFLFTILIILSKRVYRILKLWATYQYQYRKGLFLTWLEKRKEKSMQQNEIVTYNKSIKEDTTDDIKIITVE